VKLAEEIFVDHYLVPPVWIPPERVGLIVDVGANAGLSCLYWLATYWAARVIAFDPDPNHAVQFRVNMARDHGLLRRVTMNGVAAGTAGDRAGIVLSSPALNAMRTGCGIGMTEVLAELAGLRIDIMKIDIGYGGYDLLGDPRFADLDVKVLVLVSRPPQSHQSEHDWCSDRLTKLGFRLNPTFNRDAFQVTWGYQRHYPGGLWSHGMANLEDSSMIRVH
jgi:hypothetical protein